jgi:SCP1.201-like deaminase
LFNGGKTNGVLVVPSGKQIPFIGGRQGPAQFMPKGTRGFDAYTRTHAEGHAVAWMRQNNIREGTIYINNPRICNNCNTNLPSMLGPGRKLNVVLPNGKVVTYQGQ